MSEVLISTLITAVIGAISAVWAYLIGRGKQKSENATAKAEALRELNETIDLQSARINDLYEVVLTLESKNHKLAVQNEKLLANQESLKAEIEALRRELAQYKNQKKRIARDGK